MTVHVWRIQVHAYRQYWLGWKHERICRNFLTIVGTPLANASGVVQY